MNLATLQKIVDAYTARHDQMNDEDNREYMKWLAVRQFQENWDIAAEDFGGMFREATIKAEDALFAKGTLPVQGIITLCDKGSEVTERVREIFTELIKADNGDLGKRQERIENFIAAMNELIEDELPGRDAFRQDRTAAMAYLCGVRPDDNYLYLPKAVRYFAEICDCGDELIDDAEGAELALKQYYEVCDDIYEKLKDMISENQKILDNVTDTLSKAVNEDDDSDDADGDEDMTEMPGFYHIFVYDIIYCTQAYNLYEEKTAKKRTPAKTKTQKIEEARAKVSELGEKHGNRASKLAEIQTEQEGIVFSGLEGLAVDHKKFGAGFISRADIPYIYVTFGEGDKAAEKKFVLPDAFARGFLKSDDGEVEEKCRRLAELNSQEKAMAKELTLVDLDLAEAEKELDKLK